MQQIHTPYYQCDLKQTHVIQDYVNYKFSVIVSAKRQSLYLNKTKESKSWEENNETIIKHLEKGYRNKQEIL